MAKNTRDSQSMSGVIRVKKNSNYSVTNNTGARDKRLSLGAKGILWYALTRPDDWELRVIDLIECNPEGEFAIKRMMRELKKFGYLKQEKVRQLDGKYKWMTTIYEVPQNEDFSLESTKKPSGENQPMEKESPSGGFPPLGKPLVGNHLIKEVLREEILNNEILKEVVVNTPAREENVTEKPTPPPQISHSKVHLPQTIAALCEVCSLDSEYLSQRDYDELQKLLPWLHSLEEFRGNDEALAAAVRQLYGPLGWTRKTPPRLSQIRSDWLRQSQTLKNEKEKSYVNPRSSNQRGSIRQQAADGRRELRRELERIEQQESNSYRRGEVLA